MELFRIVKKDYADLEGIGGIYAPGRWHHEGNRVVYLSETISLAAWEKYLNIASPKLLPPDLVFMRVFVPDSDILKVPKKVLIKGWDEFPHLSQTMDFGTDFLREGKHLLLQVPSAVVPQEHNYLLNPRHSNIKDCKILKIVPFKFDARLEKL